VEPKKNIFLKSGGGGNSPLFEIPVRASGENRNRKEHVAPSAISPRASFYAHISMKSSDTCKKGTAFAESPLEV
jgi:hypothetical protein